MAAIYCVFIERFVVNNVMLLILSANNIYIYIYYFFLYIIYEIEIWQKIMEFKKKPIMRN